jgi:lipoprotein-anchoring transpeptidase ErfK/SrfK
MVVPRMAYGSPAAGRRGIAVTTATCLLALAAFLALSPRAGADVTGASQFRVVGAGTLTGPTAVRAQPRVNAAQVGLLRQFRPDYRPQYVLALSVVKARKTGRPLWYRLSVPGRPNGKTGWVPASAVDLWPVKKRIFIDVGARRFEFWSGRRLLRSGRVAVGAPGTETPTGLYYVTWKFDPRIDPNWSGLGNYAFETSAYSPNLSDWPGGGIVGLHGTPQPELLGQAVSHGCVRMHNRDAEYLKHRVPLGTPVKIVP